MMQVLRSRNSNFAIELAVSPTHATLLHFVDGPFKIETFLLSREYQSHWVPVPGIDGKTLAERWLNHPLKQKPYGSEDALRALYAIAADEEWTSAKVEKVEKQAARAEQGSSRARDIIRTFDYTNAKESKKIYDACEAAGINRKLAASVLCNLRKKIAAPPKPAKAAPSPAKKPRKIIKTRRR